MHTHYFRFLCGMTLTVAVACVNSGCSKPEPAKELAPDPVHSKEVVGAAKAAPKPETAPAAAPSAPAAEAPKAAEGEAHHHTAPHGGTLVMIGEHAGHFEFVLDASAGTLTAYALDGEAENPVRLHTLGIVLRVEVDGKPLNTLTLQPVESVLTGETAASTSQFAAQADELKGLTRFQGVIPELEFRGMEFEDWTFSFPEGNE